MTSSFCCDVIITSGINQSKITVSHLKREHASLRSFVPVCATYACIYCLLLFTCSYLYIICDLKWLSDDVITSMCQPMALRRTLRYISRNKWRKNEENQRLLSYHIIQRSEPILRFRVLFIVHFSKKWTIKSLVPFMLKYVR